MPVNTAALKTFAPAMRRQLLEAVGRKLDLLLNSQTPDTLSTYAKQISELRNQEAENRDQLLERVAYTWFNRLCALRYLDARGWHPFGCKVLMPAAEGETQPELLKLMRAGSLPAELKAHINEAQLHGLLDGQIPTAIAGADPQGEVYRELVLASCRSYHHLLPELFEGLDDASELLLPDDLLSEGSIVGTFRSAISDKDCEDVEIIGWLYQFYISEKKDQVIGKVVKSEDIPAATQLFTPNWIVKYMVQNSLGATWLATYPDSPLKGEMEFYIEPAEQTEEVNAELADITPESLDPEELTLIDPACGSGHILVEAYDLLKAIYLERGYRQRDIPELILTKNLYGLDICPRAAQLATFSLLMRGREDDRRLLERGIQLNVMALQDSAGLNVERLAASVDLAAAGVSRADVRMLTELFAQATILGSLIRVPAVLAEKLAALSHLGERVSEDLLAARDISRLRLLARQAAMLARRYDAIAANPPYMGGKFQNAALKSYLKTYYAGYERDIYTAFVIRCMEATRAGSRIGIVCPNTWMYISTHEKFRAAMVSNAVLDSLAEMPLTAIRGATVQVCAFAFRPACISNTEGIYFRLSKTSLDYSELPAVFKALIKNPDKGYVFKAAQRMFKLIPRSPFAYWISKDMLDVFQKGSPMSLVAEARQGLATADNNRFVRLWHEVSIRNINFCASSRETAKKSGRKWFPYNKGGDFRKWFGNQEHVVNWRDDGKELYEFRPKAVIRNPDYYFLPSITWTLLSSSYFGVRRLGEGFIFDVNGMSLFGKKERLDQILPFMTSVVSKALLDIINPTFAFQVGDIEQLPVIHLKHGLDNVASNSEALQFIHREDWNSCERAWDFGSMPLLTLGLSSIIDLRHAFCKWIERSQNAT